MNSTPEVTVELKDPSIMDQVIEPIKKVAKKAVEKAKEAKRKVSTPSREKFAKFCKYEFGDMVQHRQHEGQQMSYGKVIGSGILLLDPSLIEIDPNANVFVIKYEIQNGESFYHVVEENIVGLL